ncbi:DUF1365 domain-containing protein [Kribbella qitaiheensis]|uniref:DUF1365 domain-containing protein n=1 Tax=Kribbella qitaiheensis TaxID=1544730 RepID=UPI001FE7BA10|nr:DUF1365 domain-containing protein [Kribbella qitaiheensis]
MPLLPAVVPGRVSHTRRVPLRHRFAYRTYQWLVDIDDLPRHGVLASFSPSDHLGSPDRTLRENVAAFTAEQGVALEPDDRVVMLANARSLGYVFDPLSVFWCLKSTGELRCVVLEIHNTYGERHAQLARPDDTGRFSLGKEFYVSPFFTVNGRYDVLLRLDSEQASVAITLVQDDHRVFSASFSGRPRVARTAAVVAAALRTPFVTYQVWALIRVHGIRLWLRRLPVVPRRPHVPSKGV